MFKNQKNNKNLIMKIIPFTYFISFIELILTEEQNKIYKCGVGQYKIEPPEFGNEIPINYSSPLYKRQLILLCLY